MQTLHNLQQVLKDLMVQGEFLPPNLQVLVRVGGGGGEVEADASVAPAGLTWRDDTTQDAIGRELSRLPTLSSSSKPRQKMAGRLETRTQSSTNVHVQHERVMKSLIFRQPRDPVGEKVADPDVMQQYVDYVILDPSQSSVHMQAPLLDRYTYRQVRGGPFKTHKLL